jgi:hypothetical protein
MIGLQWVIELYSITCLHATNLYRPRKMATKISEEPLPVLQMSMESAFIQRLVTVLQSGFFRNSVQGETLFSFLSSLPGFTEDYISNSLQTIFLNGDSVDDVDLAFSEDSAILALSAAMPGLAGSLFRKCSPLVALRKTAVQKELSLAKSPVVVQVKLFNVIAVEKGRTLLADGVVLNCQDLLSFLQLRPTLVEAMCDITFNSRPIISKDLLTQLELFPKILLKCKSNDV